mgnify:CR=1 FL=1
MTTTSVARNHAGRADAAEEAPPVEVAHLVLVQVQVQVRVQVLALARTQVSEARQVAAALVPSHLAVGAAVVVRDLARVVQH